MARALPATAAGTQLHTRRPLPPSVPVNKPRCEVRARRVNKAAALHAAPRARAPPRAAWNARGRAGAGKETRTASRRAARDGRPVLEAVCAGTDERVFGRYLSLAFGKCEATGGGTPIPCRPNLGDTAAGTAPCRRTRARPRGRARLTLPTPETPAWQSATAVETAASLVGSCVRSFGTEALAEGVE
eukprot:358512-Chlamydomonas_euryale.AAC.2